MVYTDEWKPKYDLKEMSMIVCINPSCGNFWYYKSDRIWDDFTCVKCGSTWYGERQKTNTQESQS